MLSGGTEDSNPYLATPTNEENEKRGWGLPGGGICEGKDLSVVRVPQEPVAARALLGFIVCGRTTLPSSSRPASENVGICPAGGRAGSPPAGLGSHVMVMTGDGGKGSPKLPLAPAMDL